MHDFLWWAIIIIVTTIIKMRGKIKVYVRGSHSKEGTEGVGGRQFWGRDCCVFLTLRLCVIF